MLFCLFIDQFKFVEAGKDTAIHDIWIPCFETMSIGQDLFVNHGKKKWPMIKMTDGNDGVSSPLAYDAKRNVRLVTGLFNTDSAVSCLVSLSMKQWDPTGYRKFLVVVSYHWEEVRC